MFVQKTASRRGQKVYTSYLIRESFRTPDGPRSRTICNITQLPPATRELIERSLKGESLASVDSACLSEALDFGGLAVLRDAWTRFGLRDLFKGIPTDQAARLQAIVFSRLLFPCSRAFNY